MRNAFKGVLAALIALCLALTVMPVSALPSDESETADVNHSGWEKTVPEWKTWSQSDSRWGSLTLGWGSGVTVAAAGCLATSITKLGIQSGCRDYSSWNVYNYVCTMNDSGGFSSGGWLASWYLAAEAVGNGFEYITQISKGDNGVNTSSVQAEIKGYVNEGYQIVLQVPGNPQHWIAVDNELTVSNDQVWIMDSVTNLSLNSRTLTSAYSTLYRIVLFRGQVSYIDPYANLGDDFYAVILNYECWKPIEMNTQNYKIYLQTEVGSAAQKWRFQRQSDGAYVITSCYNGRALEMTDGIREVCTQLSARPFWGGAYQQWFLIRYGNGYIFKSKHFQDENWCMDLYGANSYDGNIIQINNRNNSTAQIWSIYTGDEVQLHGTTITASVDGNNVTVTWPRVYGALSYNLKIWKDELWQGDVFYAEYDTHSGTMFSLPRGTYYMYVDSIDYYQYFMSNVITLEITYSPPPQGDIDNNGEITISDALLAMRFAMGIISLTEFQQQIGDVDGDGEVTISDALLIMRAAMGIIEL